MEGGENILDAIFDEDNFDVAQDVDMMDVEEGELLEQESHTERRQNIGGDVAAENQDSSRNFSKHRNKKKKKKNRRKKGSFGSNGIDINRFVLDVSKRLKERKTYLVYTAVGCLGVSALSDLVKEVEAIQACGGQKTADGRRFRTGGGILWSVLKIRDPNAYKEIMKKGKEFEKQFRQQNVRQGSMQSEKASPERVDHKSAASPRRMDHRSVDWNTENASDGLQTCVQNPLEQSNVEAKRVSVHDRVRVPVTYDDLLGGEDQKEIQT